MALLGPTLLLRQDVGPVPQVERADPLRALELMGGDRQHVGAERLDVDVDVRRRLDGIDSEQHVAMGPHAATDLGDRLDRPDLVVGEHDRDEDRLVVDRSVELVRIDSPITIDRQLDDLEAEPLEIAERVADGMVLDRRGDDSMPAGLAGPSGAFEGEVVRLRAAGREDDLARLGVEARRHALVCLVEGGPRLSPERVRAGRVAELLREEGQHRVECLGPERRRRGVVEVDRHGPRLYAAGPLGRLIGWLRHGSGRLRYSHHGRVHHRATGAVQPCGGPAIPRRLHAGERHLRR